MELEEIARALEAVLFAAGDSVEIQRIAQVLGGRPGPGIRRGGGPAGGVRKRPAGISPGGDGRPAPAGHRSRA